MNFRRVPKSVTLNDLLQHSDLHTAVYFLLRPT